MSNNAEETKRLKQMMEAEIADVIQAKVNEFREATGFDVSDVSVRMAEDRQLSESSPRSIVSSVEAEVKL